MSVIRLSNKTQVNHSGLNNVCTMYADSLICYENARKLLNELWFKSPFCIDWLAKGKNDKTEAKCVLQYLFMSKMFVSVANNYIKGKKHISFSILMIRSLVYKHLLTVVGTSV